MASKGIVGFVGLDDLSLEMAASLLRSGYSVKAFEVNNFLIFLFVICFPDSVWFLRKWIGKTGRMIFLFYFLNLTWNFYQTQNSLGRLFSGIYCLIFFLQLKRKKRNRSAGETVLNFMKSVFKLANWESRKTRSILIT